MKTTKKHAFAHLDPEKVSGTKETKTKSGRVTTNREDNIPRFIYRDLGRTAYIISAFIILLGILFLIETKTNWLAPVLKLFGI